MSKRKFVLATALPILFFALFSGCDKKVGKKLDSAAPPVGACDTITYTKHIKPIIEANCNSCHGNPLSGGAPIPLTNYSEVKTAADNGTLKSTVVDAVPYLMPYNGSPLPQAQKNLIICWVSNGEKQ